MRLLPDKNIGLAPSLGGLPLLLLSLSTANLSALFLCHSGRSMWKKGIGRGRGRYIGLWQNGWVPWVVFSLSKGGRREATAGHRSVRARLESTPGHSWSSAISNDNFSETAVTVFITRHSEYNDYAQCLVCDVVLEVVVRQNTRGTGRKTFRIKEKVALYTDLQLHSITISRSFSGSRK